MRRWATLIASIGAAALLAAAPAPADLIVPPNDERESVTLAVGQRLDVRFPVRFSIGFRWVVGKIDGDAIVFEKSEGIYGNASHDPLPKGVDVQRITFLAGKAGTATIDFEFKRPWEKTMKPQKTRRLSVTVK